MRSSGVEASGWGSFGLGSGAASIPPLSRAALTCSAHMQALTCSALIHCAHSEHARQGERSSHLPAQLPG